MTIKCPVRNQFSVHCLWTTGKQNENKKKTNKQQQQQHQHQQIKIDMTILKFSSQGQKH